VDGSLNARPQQPCKQRSKFAATEAETAAPRTKINRTCMMTDEKKSRDRND
jgi:hypothetical protein